MTKEAQIESGPFALQNEGGPLNVTKMLAAVIEETASATTTPAQRRSKYLFAAT